MNHLQKIFPAMGSVLRMLRQTQVRTDNVAGFLLTKIMRTKNSCRFAAYYKVQFWNERQMAWQDVQKQFATVDDAKAQFIAGKKYRIMEVTEKGRKPLP